MNSPKDIHPLIVVAAVSSLCSPTFAQPEIPPFEPFPAVVDLSSLNPRSGTTLQGAAALEFAGQDVSVVGDLNGDGINDYAIGVPDASPGGRTGAGTVYVVFGTSRQNALVSETLSQPFELSTLLEFTEGTGAEFSREHVVTGAADVNGDGVNDIMLGQDEVFVVYGRSPDLPGPLNRPFDTTLDIPPVVGLPEELGFKMVGVGGRKSVNFPRFIGDINADGIDDFAMFSDAEQFENDPRTYILFGQQATEEEPTPFDLQPNVATAPEADRTLEAPAIIENPAILGDADVDGFRYGNNGTWYGYAGDINADGIDDVFFSMRKDDPGDRACVVFGSADPIPVEINPEDLDGENGFCIQGTAFQNAVGDLNGDGIDDLIVASAAVNENNVINVVYGRVKTIANPAPFGALLNLSAATSGSSGFTTTVVEARNFTGTQELDTGDLNGDGVDDLIIGSSGFTFFDRTTSGRVIVVYGRSFLLPEPLDEQISGVVDLNEIEDPLGFIIVGPEASGGPDGIGAAVTNAGDLNNDGVDDLAFGFYSGDPGGVSNAGQSYVFYGRGEELLPPLNAPFPEFIDLQDFERDFADVAFRLDGAVEGFLTGHRLVELGDINGDGLDDLAIGSRFGDGSTYLVFGRSPSDLSSLSQINGVNGFVINGLDPGDGFGFSVAAAGDVNGDGLDDMVIGAPFADPSGLESAGEAYLIYGRSLDTPFFNTRRIELFPAVLEVSDLDGSDGFVIVGETLFPGAYTGWAVGGTDFNDDEIGDLLVGAPGAFTLGSGGGFTGRTYVVYGIRSSVTTPNPFGVSYRLSNLNFDLGVVFTGTSDGVRSGSAVSGLDDFNADGINDLVIGSPVASPPGLTNNGEVHVVFGTTSTLQFPFALTGVNGSNGFLIDGPDALGRLGDSVGDAGDVNADGLSDLLIGAPEADVVGKRIAGKGYVVFGFDQSFTPMVEPVDLSMLDGTDGFIAEGLASGDFAGFSVSTAGDINGDDIDDLIITSPDAELPGRRAAGTAYVIFGSGSSGGQSVQGFPASFDLASLDGVNGFSVIGAAGGDGAGWAVSSGRDINGDNVPDIVIGAPFATGSDIGSGEVYTVFGRAGCVEIPPTVQATCLGRFNGRDYFVSDERVTISGARSLAAEITQASDRIAYPFVPDDEAEIDWVRPRIDAAESHWLGISDELTEGAFLLDCGAAVLFTRWRPNAPNDVDGSEDHVVINADDEGRWDDVAGSSTHFAVIEVERDLTAPSCSRTAAVNFSASGSFEAVATDFDGDETFTTTTASNFDLSPYNITLEEFQIRGEGGLEEQVVESTITRIPGGMIVNFRFVGDPGVQWAMNGREIDIDNGVPSVQNIVYRQGDFEKIRIRPFGAGLIEEIPGTDHLRVSNGEYNLFTVEPCCDFDLGLPPDNCCDFITTAAAYTSARSVTLTIIAEGESPADTNGDGVLDDADIMQLLDEVALTLSRADATLPRGVYDFFDIRAWLITVDPE